MIRFADLVIQHARLRPELDAAIAGVLDRAEFVLGPPVAGFERAFAEYCDTDHAVAVNSGTSALHLALIAAGVQPGDEVITSAFTFVATVAAIAYTGATPVLADISDEWFTIDPKRVAAAITPRTRVIVPVHLYGQPADMNPILELARRHGIAVIEDASQAHGAEYRGRRAGSLGDAACFSFYPSKNLGACGEGGCIVTSNAELADELRRLRDWGAADARHQRVPGFNYRMSGLQGAVLGVKLRHLDEWNAARRDNAAHYDAAAAGSALRAPAVMPGSRHVYHIYGARSSRRAAVQETFRLRGIETRIHYDTPIHLLDAWRHLGYGAGDFPEAERASREVFSIPVHPELSAQQVELVTDAIRSVSNDPTVPTVSRRRRTPRREHAES